jgi:prepilin-type N-terminal cleavage/methylation domain-containing protein
MKMERVTLLRGFSLIEVLVSLIVLSVAAVGVTAAWKLADQKALRARLENRASRVLREHYEEYRFSPETPFNSMGKAIGYLYRPHANPSARRATTPGEAEYAELCPYEVKLENEGRQLVLHYKYPDGTDAPAKVIEIGNVSTP